MAHAHLPDAFYDLVAHHLPLQQPVGPKGGRPRIRHRTALKVIWFVLVCGCRWEDVPAKMGWSGRTAQRRPGHWEGLGIWNRLHEVGLDAVRVFANNSRSRAACCG